MVFYFILFYYYLSCTITDPKSYPIFVRGNPFPKCPHAWSMYVCMYVYICTCQDLAQKPLNKVPTYQGRLG
jgi:hypothetical protein